VVAEQPDVFRCAAALYDEPMLAQSSRPKLLAINGPGLIVAATGVGAGDLATGGA
jgi:hypothetical protein